MRQDSFLRRQKLSISQKAWPPFWRKIRSTRNPGQLRNWQLVLVSQNLPFLVFQHRGQSQIYAPALLSDMAAWQLETFERENHPPARQQIEWPSAPHAFYVFLPLFLLAIWHGMQQGTLPKPAFLPDQSLWLKLGALDSVRIQLYGEYHRAITALTLHANASHLIGNIFFATLFLLLLARRLGYGRAFLLATICGAAGNLVALAFHNGPWLSIGFSTAVFAAAGALAGLMACAANSRKKFLLPVGAALALLALLGSEGENTDYAAHCAGLACGFIGGLFAGWRLKRKLPALPDPLALILAFCLYSVAWIASFNL